MSESSKRKYISRTSRLRDAMIAAVTPRDIYEITKLQVFLALKGDPLAAREVLDRTVGKAVDVAQLMELEKLATPTAELMDIDAEIRQMEESVPLMLPAAVGGEAEAETGAA